MSQNSDERALVKVNEINNVIKSGQDFLDKVGTLMHDEDFRVFFDDNFNTWSNIEGAIMMMKTYAFVQEEYLRQTGTILNKQETVNIVRSMFMDGECRRRMVEEMDSFMKNKQDQFMATYLKNLIMNKK